MGRIVGLIIDHPAAPTTFICPECGKGYKTTEGLNRHLDKEHPWGREQDNKQ